MKLSRHAAILEIVRAERIGSQEDLRELLGERGFDVAQATLSRDLRELGLVKVPDEAGGSVYSLPTPATEPSPTLARLLPALFLKADGVGNLLVIRTLAGGAQSIAVAIDHARWPEIVGTIAGDDSILLVLREAQFLPLLTRRIQGLAGNSPAGKG